MKAMVYQGQGHFSLENVPEPKMRRKDDIIVRNLVCSICGTDVHMAAPDYAKDMRGRIFGHEIVGEVVEKGPDVCGLENGDRVVVNPNYYCGNCEMCRTGLQNHCTEMELMGISHPGGFSEYVCCNSRMVFPIKRELPLKYAVFAEPLACVCNGFGKLKTKVNGCALQIGCGPIGLLFAQLARSAGEKVLCLEPSDFRRATAERIGYKTLSPFEENVGDKINAFFGKRPEIIIDAAGGQLGKAVEYAGFRTQILCFASPRKVKAETNLAGIQSKELVIRGSFIIDHTMPQAIGLLENNLLQLDPLITHVLPLEQLELGMEYMRSGKGMEIILTIGSDFVD